MWNPGCLQWLRPSSSGTPFVFKKSRFPYRKFPWWKKGQRPRPLKKACHWRQVLSCLALLRRILSLWRRPWTSTSGLIGLIGSSWPYLSHPKKRITKGSIALRQRRRKPYPEEKKKNPFPQPDCCLTVDCPTPRKKRKRKIPKLISLSLHSNSKEEDREGTILNWW